MNQLFFALFVLEVIVWKDLLIDFIGCFDVIDTYEVMRSIAWIALVSGDHGLDYLIEALGVHIDMLQIRFDLFHSELYAP